MSQANEIKNRTAEDIRDELKHFEQVQGIPQGDPREHCNIDGATFTVLDGAYREQVELCIYQVCPADESRSFINGKNEIFPVIILIIELDNTLS